MKRTLLHLTFLLVLSCKANTDNSANGEIQKPDSLAKIVQPKENKLDTLLNTNDYLVLGAKHSKVKVVRQNEVGKFPTFKTIISFKNDVILGENLSYHDLKIYRKYRPKSTFEDYPVDIYEGELAAPDFSTNPSAKRFVTNIKSQCTDGINFAGHYTLVIWGCGTACQSGVVVDRITGRIWDGYGSALGSEFKKDSKLIICGVEAIDTTTNLIEQCAYCGVRHEIWTGTEFKEIE